MNKLKAEVSSPNIESDAVLINGELMLYKLHWPTDGLVKNLVDGAEKYIRKIIPKSNVFLIFDRYMPGSSKSYTRDTRVGAFSCSLYQLSLNRELPQKNMCLHSTTTKQNFIDLISGEFCDQFTNNASSKWLVITLKNIMPDEIHCGLRIKRHGLVLYYGENDFMIAQQLNSIIDEKKQAVIKVLSDDTGVLVLLFSNFKKINWSSAKLYKDAFTDDNKLTKINNQSLQKKMWSHHWLFYMRYLVANLCSWCLE